jgi:hypothetical protein
LTLGKLLCEWRKHQDSWKDIRVGISGHYRSSHLVMVISDGRDAGTNKNLVLNPTTSDNGAVQNGKLAHTYREKRALHL